MSLRWNMDTKFNIDHEHNSIRRINQSMCLGNQSIKQTYIHTNKQSNKQTNEQSTNQPASQPTNQPTQQIAHQTSINQSNQLTN
jgi:hypothetical protein